MQRNVLKYFAKKSVATLLNLAKNDKSIIMSKNQFTETATQPQRNRKLCQFNNDQYCNNWNVSINER